MILNYVDFYKVRNVVSKEYDSDILITFLDLI